jgi:Ca-activated chloride channel family protein
MKYCIAILVLFISALSYSQEWRDSLSVARQAYKKKEYKKALDYYRSAQKKAPENIDLSDEMGQSAYKAREFEQAEKIYQQSTTSKKDKDAKARTYHNMGNSRMQKKDYQGAIESYKESLRNKPNDEETRYNLSEAIRRQNKDKKNDQDQDQNKDQNDQNKDQKNNNKNQNQNQNKDQNKGHGNNNNQNNQQDQNKGDGQNPSRLPNKSVERMLDQLMKAESQTKRKIGGQKGQSDSTKSGKDW